MAFVLDSDGTLHDDRATHRPGCTLGQGTTSATYNTGQEAFEAQDQDIKNGADPAIRHFCPFCLPDTSWEAILS